MKSGFPITRISDGAQPAVLAYFDICPESPGGNGVVYNLLPPEGPNNVAYRAGIATRDGTGHRAVGPPTLGNYHTGARPQWIAGDEIAYAYPGNGRPETACVNIHNGSVRTVPGALRMYSFEARKGLSSSHDARLIGIDIAESVSLMDLTAGTLKEIFTVEDVAAIHPRQKVARQYPVYFKHTKWSADGRRFMTVFHNADTPAFRNGEIDRSHRIKSIMIAEADGSGLRHFSEFHHHPAWHPRRDAIVTGASQPQTGPCLLLHPLDGSEPSLFASGTGVHSSISPDGRYVATDRYGKGMTGDCTVERIDVETGESEVLATFPAPQPPYDTSHAHPAWSRDGKRIYFNAMEDGLPQVYAVDVE